MNQRRIELHKILCSVLGSKNVYYQPPTSVKLQYPCIIYQLDAANDVHANDHIYRRLYRYSLTYITKNPDDPMRDKIDDIRYCSFNRYYAADNLNHYTYTIYY